MNIDTKARMRTVDGDRRQRERILRLRLPPFRHDSTDTFIQDARSLDERLDPAEPILERLDVFFPDGNPS